MKTNIKILLAAIVLSACGRSPLGVLGYEAAQGSDTSATTSVATGSATSTKSEVSTANDTSTLTVTKSDTGSVTSTVTATQTKTNSASATSTGTPTATATATASNTNTPSNTSTGTVTATATTTAVSRIPVIASVDVQKVDEQGKSSEDTRRFVIGFNGPAVDIRLKVTESLSGAVIVDSPVIANGSKDEPVAVNMGQKLKPNTRYTYNVSAVSTDGLFANDSWNGEFTTSDFGKPAALTRLEIRLDSDSPYGRIILSNTRDNTMLRLNFTAPNGPINLTRLTAQFGYLFAARSVILVRFYDQNGTLFCDGALDKNGRIKCSNNDGLFTVNGSTTITLKINVGQIGSGGAVSGDPLSLALYVGKDASDSVIDDIAAIDMDGNVYTDNDVGIEGIFPPHTTTERSSGFDGAAIKIYGAWFGDVWDNAWLGAKVIDHNVMALSGYPCMLHLTAPTFARVPVNETLMNGQQPVLKWTETADQAGSFSQKNIQVNRYTDGGVSAEEYRLYCGGLDCSDLVSIASQNKTDAGIDRIITITWKNAATVSGGTTRNFELRATVSGAKAGVTLKHSLPFIPACGRTREYDAELAASPFAWSDMSADAHSESSSDWSDGCDVRGFESVTQTLAL